jgi:hypothetical protein
MRGPEGMRASTVADVRLSPFGLQYLANISTLLDTFVQYIRRRASANLP